MPNDPPRSTGGDAGSSPPDAGRPLPGAHESRAGGTAWPRLLLGLALVDVLFHGAATALGSDRGQAGLLVCALVVAATLCVERLLFGEPPGRAARALGVDRPRARGLLAAAGADASLPLVWMAASALLPFLVFLVPRRAGAATPGTTVATDAPARATTTPIGP